MAEIISFYSRKSIQPATIAYRQAFNDAAPANFWQVAKWCKRHQSGKLNHKERQFIESMTHRLVMYGQPTERQAIWLRSIYARLREQEGGQCR